MSLLANYDEVTPSTPINATAAWPARTQLTFAPVSLVAYVPAGTTLVRLTIIYGGGGTSGDDVRVREVGDASDTTAHSIHLTPATRSNVQTNEFLMRLDANREFEARHATAAAGSGAIQALTIKGYWLGENP